MLYFRLITSRGKSKSDVERSLTVPVPSDFNVYSIEHPELVGIDFDDDIPRYRVEILYPDKRDVYYVCTRDHAFIMNADFKTVETIYQPGRYSAEIREKYLSKKRK